MTISQLSRTLPRNVFAGSVLNSKQKTAWLLEMSSFAYLSSTLPTSEHGLPTVTILVTPLPERAEHIFAGRSEDDILYELLLKLGLDLCLRIETRGIAGKTVRSVGASTLIVCLAENIASDDAELLRSRHRPSGIPSWNRLATPPWDFDDSAVGDDAAKTNLTAILEQRGLGNLRSL